ncbi:MAG: hypothetical protein LBS75_00115 [Synergistaceae bacterium]|jgi:hypothetical protein|nr:hypothetical protein [Synergistaceae bacterium]
MVRASAAIVRSLFTFSDEETKFVRDFLAGFHSAENKHQGKTVCDSEIPLAEYDMLRAAVKGMCLFWVDHYAHQTCVSERDLKSKRALLKRAMESYCARHPGNSLVMLGMLSMRGEIERYYLSNAKDGLDEDANLESYAFFMALVKNGFFLSERYVGVQKMSREFLKARRKKMCDLLQKTW